MILQRATYTAMKKKHPIIAIQLLIIILAIVGCSVRQKPEKNPNIIVILADDQGWTDAGFMGSNYYETPNMDALAASGMVFTNGYANAPNCAPSRACLMTGKYTPSHGIYTVGSSARGKSALRKLIPTENKTFLDTGFITIAELLAAKGYTSSSIGKWHLGNDSLGSPVSQGFTENAGGNHIGHPRSYFSPHRNPNLPAGPEGEYLPDRLTEEARDIIADNAIGLEKEEYLHVIIRIEGHCDERGSDEYNMALGEKRAATAREYLTNYGISPDRISIISYGESMPVDPGHNEEAWAKNRRAEFIKVSE